MKIVSNTRLIQRNKKLGQFTTIAALVILGVGLYVSFTAPEQITITFGALLLGFLLSQVGIFFGNRWGKSPRPDELLSAALKGLDDKYTLYHYSTGTPHLLVGPSGVMPLIPLSMGGNISYDSNKKRFRQKGGNAYLKIFGQESLGRPDAEAGYAQNDMVKYLKKNLGEVQIPPIEPVLVFTNPKVELDSTDAPIMAVTLEKLKDNIRKKSKESPAPITTIQLIQKTLPEA